MYLYHDMKKWLWNCSRLSSRHIYSMITIWWFKYDKCYLLLEVIRIVICRLCSHIKVENNEFSLFNKLLSINIDTFRQRWWISWMERELKRCFEENITDSQPKCLVSLWYTNDGRWSLRWGIFQNFPGNMKKINPILRYTKILTKFDNIPF